MWNTSEYLFCPFGKTRNHRLSWDSSRESCIIMDFYDILLYIEPSLERFSLLWRWNDEFLLYENLTRYATKIRIYLKLNPRSKQLIKQLILFHVITTQNKFRSFVLFYLPSIYLGNLIYVHTNVDAILDRYILSHHRISK